MSLPQLPPEPIRPECEDPNTDKEIWQPRWRCFCCHDTGTISPSLVQLVVPGYDFTKHKTVACQHPRCEPGRRFQGDLNYDQRFTAGICNSLDQINRDDWRKVVKTKFELAQRMKAENEALVDKLAMPGSRERSANDNREIQQRKQEVEAISHEDWLAMSSQSLGGEAEDSSIAM